MVFHPQASEQCGFSGRGTLIKAEGGCNAAERVHPMRSDRNLISAAQPGGVRGRISILLPRYKLECKVGVVYTSDGWDMRGVEKIDGNPTSIEGRTGSRARGTRKGLQG